MIHHVRTDERLRNAYCLNHKHKNMHTLASVRCSYRRVINARYSVVYSSLASSLFSSRKLSNGEAVRRRRATSCLPLVYPHVMYHPRPSTFSQSFPPPHGRTINARNKNGETRNGEGLEPRLPNVSSSGHESLFTQQHHINIKCF